MNEHEVSSSALILLVANVIIIAVNTYYNFNKIMPLMLISSPLGKTPREESK